MLKSVLIIVLLVKEIDGAHQKFLMKRNFDGNWYRQLNANSFGKRKLSVKGSTKDDWGLFTDLPIISLLRSAVQLIWFRSFVKLIRWMMLSLCLNFAICCFPENKVKFNSSVWLVYHHHVLFFHQCLKNKTVSEKKIPCVFNTKRTRFKSLRKEVFVDDSMGKIIRSYMSE